MGFLLYCSSDEATVSRYTEIFESRGYPVTPIHDLNKLFQSPYRDHEYSGIVIDVISRMKSSYVDKTILRNLEEVYPTLLVKLCADGQVNYMPVQARLGADLDSFLRYCSTIKPRRYRIQDRREVYLSVRLSDHAGLEKHILSFTMDLSEGGCFVASSQVWEKKQKLYLDIICLKDRTPILCEVRWSRSWGINPFVPGMGLKFLRITKSQQEQLLEMFSPAMRKAI